MICESFEQVTFLCSLCYTVLVILFNNSKYDLKDVGLFLVVIFYVELENSVEYSVL